jgi:hypothetical protein
VQSREETARFGAPKTEHPQFTVVWLNIGVQWLDLDCLFGLLWSDAVPGDMLDVGGVPTELYIYIVNIL